MMRTTRPFGRLLILLLLCCLGTTARASDELVLDSSITHRDLIEYISYLEDPARNLSAQDVLQRLDAFQPYPKETINEGYSSSVWWFSFRLYHNEQERSQWWLNIDYSLLDHIDIYELEITTGTLNHIVSTGDKRPLASRPAQTNTFAFPLQLQPQREYRYLIKIDTEGSVIVPASIHSSTGYLVHLAGQRLLIGFFQGGAFFLMLYNVGLLLVVRERLYLYYVLYVASFLLVSTNATGIGFELFWRDHFWIQSGAMPLFIMGCCIFGLLFSRNLLDLQGRSKILFRFSNFTLTANVLSLPFCAFLPYALGVQLAMINILTAIVFALIAGSHGILTRYAQARIFMLAWIALLASGIVFVLTAAGIINSNALSISSLQIGSSIELLLLSFALADRISLLKRQKTDVESVAHAEQVANKAKSDFLASMSHEIRTPMAGVLGMAELMGNTSLTHEQKQYLENIQDSSRALLDIINQILDLSKIEAHKLELEQIPFALESVLGESIKVFYAKRQHSPVRFELLLDPAVPAQINGDPTRLRQVLINLLGNAYKFTERGSITLAVRPDHNRDRIYFAVTDTGPGIAPSALPHIFQQYVQETASTARQHGGTGLGLGIAKQLVELMGGEINVQSQVGEGTTFWFTLPLQQAGSETILPRGNSPVQTHLHLFSNDVALQRQIALWCKHIAVPLEINRWPNATEQVENLVILADDIVQLRQSASILACKVTSHLLAVRRVDAEQTEFPATELPLLPSQFLRILERRQDVQTIQPAVEQDSKPISIRRVLLAEDNPVNAQVIKGLLKRLGIESDWCQNGKEAVEKLKRNTYDLVFMDCEMPVMDGYEATRQIRADGNVQLIIVALTAHAIKEYVDQAYAAGMNDYLTKPIDLATLRKSLQYWSSSPA